MYLLPWHSLSKTGSHLSTSIRWYSMGQPLSLAMIISDVTSCPEMVPYAGSMKSDRGSTSQGSGCNAQPVLEGSLFHFGRFRCRVSPQIPIDTDGIQGSVPVFAFRLFQESTALSFALVPRRLLIPV